MRKIDYHVFQGMRRDLSVSKQQPQFLWEAHNVRLTAREGDTMMSLTNEKGTLAATVKAEDGGDATMYGQYVGHCVIGNYLTVFTHADDGDDIYRLTKLEDNTFTIKALVENLDLGLSREHPLQTLGVYENEYIQKVYWTDGVKQPRMINITADLLHSDEEGWEEDYDKYSFDFVPQMQLEDSIKVRKVADSSASFGAGVVQYMVSYYNKYGQESNISCASPLISR